MYWRKWEAVLCTGMNEQHEIKKELPQFTEDMEEMELPKKMKVA